MSPQRIQLSRKKGWRLPEGAVSVARPTKWGNPFRPERLEGEWRVPAPNLSFPAFAEDRDDAFFLACSMFKRHLAIRRTPPPGWVDLIGYPSDEEIVAELAGNDLACWCPLDRPFCHARVLLELANGGDA